MEDKAKKALLFSLGFLEKAQNPFFGAFFFFFESEAFNLYLFVSDSKTK